MNEETDKTPLLFELLGRTIYARVTGNIGCGEGVPC